MPLRVDQITLPAGSPVGEYALRGLQDFDLVLVTGANGSGKTTLLRPLDAPGRANGTVGCITDAGARKKYDADGVQRSITFIRSTQLLTGFRDLSEALGLAANTVRLQHEAWLLEQLATHAEATEPEEDVSEPRRITDLKDAYLTADQACGSRPRTVAVYNQLGADLARRAQRPWTHHEPCGNSMERLASEVAIMPQLRKLEGLPALAQAIDFMPATLAAPNPPESAAARYEAAALVLAGSIEQVITELPGLDLPNPPPQQLDAAAEAMVTALQTASRSMQAALDAKDALGQCRDLADRYLRAQAGRGVTIDACPVCAHAIDASHVCAQLADSAADQDPETKRWLARKKQLDTSTEQIEAAARAWNTAAQRASAEREDILMTIDECRNALRNAVAQHAASVTLTRQEIHQHCTEWIDKFASAAPSAAAVASARALVLHARALVDARKKEERDLNQGLKREQEDFAEFQALGNALAARASLDALPWKLALDEVQAAERRRAQRDRWIKTLNRMAEAKQAQADAALATVMNDATVQNRFAALLSRIRHPTVQSLRYQGSAVVMHDGKPIKKCLSEGQTALVNIAATVAVAAKVAGASGHDPGWIAFDEPTNGLDDAARHQVAEYLGGMTTQDLPCQLFVATFDEEFADRLQRAALAAGRRVRRVRMQPFRPGQPCNPQIEDLLPN